MQPLGDEALYSQLPRISPHTSELRVSHIQPDQLGDVDNSVPQSPVRPSSSPNIDIEEISDTEDAAYWDGVEVLRPDELEEPGSDNDTSLGRAETVDPAQTVTRRFSRLRCDDPRDEILRLRNERRRTQQSKEVRPSAAKRKHSQIVHSSDESDSDTRNDQEYSNDAKRLRRRLASHWESDGIEELSDSNLSLHSPRLTPRQITSAMDIDMEA